MCERILAASKGDGVAASCLQLESVLLPHANVYEHQAASTSRWGTEDIDVMDSRLASLLSLPVVGDSVSAEDVEMMDSASQATEDERLPQGWRKASVNWTPCPIGVYVAA